MVLAREERQAEHDLIFEAIPALRFTKVGLGLGPGYDCGRVQVGVSECE